MDMLPYEMVYKIMLTVSFDDIVSFCKISTRNKKLCDDSVFWMEKLDQDFSYINDVGTRVKASDYVKHYHHTDQRGIDIYRRWLEHENLIVVDVDVKFKNNDIVIWLLEKNVPDILIINDLDPLDEAVNALNTQLFVLASLAARYNNIELVNWLDQIGISSILPEPGYENSYLYAYKYLVDTNQLGDHRLFR